MEEEKIKRGRKKKEVVPAEPKIKKKRGRKAALKYFSSSIRKQMPLKSSINDNEIDILHLSIKDDQLSEDSYDIDGIDENEHDPQLHEYAPQQKKETIQDSIFEDYIDLQKNNIKKGFFQYLPKFSFDWQEYTNIKCWWCVHNFDTLPLGCPIDFNASSNKFRVQGIFCSFACVYAYALKEHKATLYLLKNLYKTLTGTFTGDFKPAPSRYTLVEFGGHLTIEQFRALSTENKTYKMINYPIFISRDYIAEIDLEHLKQANANVFTSTKNTVQLLDIQRVEDAKSRISKKQQQQPDIKSSNTIEAFLKK